MTCPKCNQKDECKNFCSNCGNQLKEKCLECGEMEWIGRKVCAKKIKEIQEQEWEFASKKLPVTEGRILLIAVAELCGSAIIWILLLVLKKNAAWLLGFIPSVVIYLLALPAMEIVRKKRQKINQEFFRLHPDLAEIIKKAE